MPPSSVSIFSQAVVWIQIRAPKTAVVMPRNQTVAAHDAEADEERALEAKTQIQQVNCQFQLTTARSCRVSD